MYPVLYAVLLGPFGFFIVNDILLPAGVLRVGGYEYLPERADQRSVGITSTGSHGRRTRFLP